MKILSQKDIPEFVKQILQMFPTGKVFAFFGELGAGKTTIIKEFCSQLGIAGCQMSSPTFTLINEYLASDGTPVFHFDFYRIKNETEVFDMGYEDYFYSGKYCFIEWAEKIPNLLPEDCVQVRINVKDGEREIMLNGDERKFV